MRGQHVSQDLAERRPTGLWRARALWTDELPTGVWTAGCPHRPDLTTARRRFEQRTTNDVRDYAKTIDKEVIIKG